MSVSSSGKRRCTDRGIRREYWQFHLRFRDSTKVQNAVFHHFSGVSGIFQLLCVGLRTRKSMAFVLNSPWLEICLAGLPQFFNFPAQLFRSQFQHPFRHTIL